jgi:putative ABC transport system permease protein
MSRTTPVQPSRDPGASLPRSTRWLLERVTPPAELPYLLDDLTEEFETRSHTTSHSRATIWLYSQTIRSLGPLAIARFHTRRAARGQLTSGDPMLTQLRDDVRYSLRVAARRPWLSLTVIATMVLGIGATTSVYSVIDALLLRPLSFPAPEQLVRLSSPVRDAPTAMVVNHDDVTDLRRETRSIASVAFFDMGGATVQVSTEPERVGTVLAGEGFAETLGLRPALGRLFGPDEYLPNGSAAVMLTHTFWVSHFAGDRSIIGKSLLVSGRPRTIVGVLPAIESEYPPGEFDLWLPLIIPPDSYLRGRYAMQIGAIARLRPGATVERVNTELAALERRLAAEYPQSNTGRTLEAIPLRETIVGPVRPMLVLLGAAVAAVLLIACANLGSLLLAHSQSRVREFAVRAAMGGASRRIARQLLVESVMLALIGGAGGIWLARMLVKGLVAVYPTGLPRAGEISLDARVLAVALGATVLTGLVAGLPLSRQVGRLDLVRDLRQGERGLGSRRGRRLLDGLVVGQIATSVALLFAAGILLRTFVDMTAIKPGFDPRNVLSFGTAPAPARFRTPEWQAASYNALFDSLRAIPGVTDVGWAMFAPLGGGGWGDTFSREGSTDAPPNLPSMQVNMVSPDYARTLRIPLLAGRSLNATDRAGASDVALVNATLAATYYPGSSPVGKRIVFQKRTLEIVGVLGDARNRSLWTPAAPELYVPIEQWGWRSGTIFVRTATSPKSLEAPIRAVVRRLNPSLPALKISPLSDRVNRSMAPERFRAILIGTLAALALLLSVLGIYGLVAWVVGRRTREIGIRMALGEAGTRVRLHVLADALRLGALGIAVGAVQAYGSAHYLRAFVAGDVRARDPLMLAATMLTLLVVTAAAAWLPARRASRVDPLLAIRAE